MVGMAMLTMVTSTRSMKAAVITIASANQRRRSPVGDEDGEAEAEEDGEGEADGEGEGEAEGSAAAPDECAGTEPGAAAASSASRPEPESVPEGVTGPAPEPVR